jgi:hypothetical protein
VTRVRLSLVREALLELADEDHQQRIWSAATGPEVGSLTEAVERLFDDSGLGDALRTNAAPFSPQTTSSLQELDRVLREVDDRRSPAAILRDPRLRRVRQLASTALDDPALGSDR